MSRPTWQQASHGGCVYAVLGHQPFGSYRVVIFSPGREGGAWQINAGRAKGAGGLYTTIEQGKRRALRAYLEICRHTRRMRSIHESP